MDELLPYEEQLAGKLANLTLPDEDKGWDAMRKMLEEDDDGGVIPPVNRGCGTWAVLLLLALVAGIVTLTWKRNTGHQTDAPHNATPLKDSSLAVKTPAFVDTVTLAGQTQPGNTVTDTVHKATESKQPAAEAVIPARQMAGKRMVNDGYRGMRTAARGSKKRAQQTDNSKVDKTSSTGPNAAGVTKPLSPLDVTASNVVKGPGKPTVVTPGNGFNKIPGADTVKQTDTTRTPIVALPNTRRDSSDSKKNKQGENKEDDNRVWFGAGLALQQLVPVNGQEAVPYSSSGRKGSLGDYIPSAYFRVYHKRKFFQLEFKYGAPQYTKDVAYQKTVISSDSSSGISVANVNHVKKTYYHQLPVSIHYTPLPNVSLGVGVVWNKFQSAVVEQETRSFRGNVIVDSGGTVPSKLLTLKGDSATSFSKSYLQLMFEAQYTWRRFSIGARYAFGLQPYLTFTSPSTGQQQKERNASLNIFIRYELWRSKKK